MTAIIVKFKPTLFGISEESKEAEVNTEPTKSSRKRSIDETGEAEALATAEKRAKIEDDLTPAAVDTSTA
jgi:hypothetical protein